MTSRRRIILPQLFPPEEEEIPLVALPAPFILYPFNNDFDDYSGNGLDSADPGDTEFFDNPFIVGRKALRLIAGNDGVQISSGLLPIPGTGDLTVMAHINLTDLSGFAFLLSAKRESAGTGVEFYVSSASEETERSGFVDLSKPAGSGYSIGGPVGNTTGMLDTPSWNSTAIVLDRDDVASQSVDGELGEQTLDITDAEGEDLFAASTFSVIGRIGTRNLGISHIRKEIEIYDWVVFDQTLTIEQQRTFWQLRVRGIPLDEYLES